MPGVYNSPHECFGDFSFICTTGTLLVIAEYAALTQTSTFVKVCASFCNVTGCFYLSCFYYYACRVFCEEPPEAGLHTALLNEIRYTPMRDAMRNNATTAVRSAPALEEMRRETPPRPRVSEV